MRTVSTVVLAGLASLASAAATASECSMLKDPVSASGSSASSSSAAHGALQKLFRMMAPGMDAESFMRTKFERETALFSPATNARDGASSIEGWQWPAFSLADPARSDAVLQAAMGTSGMRVERSVDGHMQPFEAGASPKQVRDLVLDQGGSAVVHLSEDDGSLGKLREAGREAFGVPVTANLYMSGKEGSALHPHTDRWDTFILQLQGAKEWTVCVPKPNAQAVQGTCAEGLEDGFTEAIRAEIAESAARSEGGCTQYGGPAWVDGKGRADMDCRQVVTQAGDFFYMPKGVVHKATEAGDGVSAHVTMGIPRPGVRFLELEELVMDDALMAGDSYGEAERQAAAVLRAALGRAAQGAAGISFRRTVPVWSIDANTDAPADVLTPELLAYHAALVQDVEREARRMVSALDIGLDIDGRHEDAHPHLPYAMATDRAWKVHQALSALLYRMRHAGSLAQALQAFLRNERSEADGESQQRDGATSEAAAARSLAKKSNHIMRPGKVSAYELVAAGIKARTAASLAAIPSARQRQLSFITSCKNACASVESTCKDECPWTQSCDGGCTSSCDNSCTGSCDEALICSGSCDGSCTGSCDSGCTTGCDKFSFSKGWTSCDGWCTSGCDSSCLTSCDSSCINTGGCDSGCTGSCDGGCTSSCDAQWSSCLSTCSSVRATCESGCEVADDIYQQIKDFAVDIATQISDIAEDVQDCIDAVSSVTLSKFENFAKCNSYLQSGYSSSATYKAAEAIKNAIDGLSSSDLDGILSSQTVSDSTCSAIWDAVQANIDLNDCWTDLANSFPSMTSCYPGTTWRYPAPFLSFGYDRTVSGQTIQYQIGLWSRVQSDRGCFVSVGETPAGPVSLNSNKWTFHMLERRQSVCAEIYTADAGAEFDLGKGFAVSVQDDYAVGDVPVALGVSSTTSASSLSGTVTAYRWWANAMSIVSGSALENPSSSAYCAFTNLWNQVASRRRVLSGDEDEEEHEHEDEDEDEQTAAQVKAALGLVPGLSSHDREVRAQAAVVVSAAMQAVVPSLQCDLTPPELTLAGDAGTTLAALPGAGSHVPRDSWLHQAWSVATGLHSDLVSLEPLNEGMLSGSADSLNEMEQALTREWLQSVCAVLSMRAKKIMPLFDAWPYMPVDPDEAAELRSSIESDLRDLEQEVGAVVASLRVGFESIEANAQGTQELDAILESSHMLTQATAAQQLLQANLTEAREQLLAMHSESGDDGDDDEHGLGLGAGLGIGGAVGCVAGVLLAAVVVVAMGRGSGSVEAAPEQASHQEESNMLHSMQGASTKNPVAAAAPTGLVLGA